MESLADVKETQCTIASLPPFMPVSMALLDILSREDAVVEQVAALLRLEPEFVAEVLELANSPAFGFQSQIRTLAHAVVLLGTKRLQALILTVSLRHGSASGHTRDFWRHSVASAFAAAELAPGYGVHPDRAFTAALLHDMGTWQALSGCAAPEIPAGLRHFQDESTVDLVRFACRISDALGFSAAGQATENFSDADILNAMPLPHPEPAADPKTVARVVREKMRYINN